jgi:hypothetical protein
MNEQIEKQRNVITKKLQREFTDEQVALIWHEINELIELEIDNVRIIIEEIKDGNS